jgi:hypothetical protein
VSLVGTVTFDGGEDAHSGAASIRLQDLVNAMRISNDPVPRTIALHSAINVAVVICAVLVLTVPFMVFLAW